MSHRLAIYRKRAELCRIRELHLLSFAFLSLSTEDDLAISLLHKTYTGSHQISIRTIDPDSLDISSEGSSFELREEDEPTRMITVPRTENEFGGLLLLGPNSIVYYQAEKLSKTQSPVKSRRTSTRKPDLSAEWRYSDIVG